MRVKIIAVCGLLICSVRFGRRAQDAQETAGGRGRAARALSARAAALDAQGRTALVGALLTQALAGTADSPVANTRFMVENRGSVFL